MKYKKKRVFAFMLLVYIGIIGLKGQSNLYVNEKTGTVTPYLLSSLRKLTFYSSNLVINKNNGNLSSFGLNSISSINFESNSTDIKPLEIQGVSNFILYPNPVVDQLHINYESIKTANVQLEIIDFMGSILQKKILSIQSGINQVIISVNQLPKGIYICRLQNGNKIETTKFIKI